MKRLYFRISIIVSVIGLAALIAATIAPAGQSRGSRNFSGQFNARVADFFDEGESVTTFTLTTDKGREYTVVFASENLVPTPGTRVTLSGRAKRGTIYAVNVLQGPLAPGLANTPIGEQRFVIALVNFQNSTTENVTVAQVETRMFDPIYSADQWWQENSYGKTWATGDVFGWITLPMNRACNAGLVRTLAIAALDGLTDLTQYNRLYILIPGAGGCGWGGLGTLGASTFSTSNGPWTTTTSWTRSEYFNENNYKPRSAVFVTVHEVGHNFARHHSESITWNAGRSFGPFDCGGCESTVKAYGDRFCSLGGSWNPGHFSAKHKLALNWFEPENVIQVTRSGIYEIDPYAIASIDPKVLRIHRGFGPGWVRDEYIIAEWRQPIGFDNEIDYSTGNVYDGVTLHYDFTTGARSYGPDMTPGDGEMRNAALAAGQTWDDLYTNVSISPLGVVDGMLQLKVKIGDPVLPTSYSIVRGFHLSGGLADLTIDDDQRLAVKAGLTLFAGEAPVWIEFETTIEGYRFGPTLGAVRFEMEARCGSVMRQRVQMFNYTTGAWDTISDGVSAYADTFVEANVWSGAERYINPVTGEMRARVEFFVDRLILSWPFIAEFDQAVQQFLADYPNLRAEWQA
ncbi:MAG: hypothetical protein IIC73_02995, partial [Armatimonadetes bacterium]|nr:hypothetical protein [Armatimonadota bacterium]